MGVRKPIVRDKYFTELPAGEDIEGLRLKLDPLGASSTGNLDSLDTATFKATKYIVAIYSDFQSVYKYFEVAVLNKNGTIEEAVSNILGDNINISLQTNVAAGIMTLEVTNSEVFSLKVEASRIMLRGA